MSEKSSPTSAPLSLDLRTPPPEPYAPLLDALPRLLTIAAIVVPILYLIAGTLNTYFLWSSMSSHSVSGLFNGLWQIIGMVAQALMYSLVFLCALAIVSMLRKRLNMEQTTHEHLRKLATQLDELNESLITAPARNTVQIAKHAPANGHTDIAHHPEATLPLSELLHEIRDMSLMTPTQRRQWAERHWAKRKATHRERIECSILKGQWDIARAHLEELKILLPDDPDLAKLDEHVANEQTERILEDVRNARAELRHLVSINAWAEAEEVMAILSRKYPTDGEVHELFGQFNHDLEAHHRHQQDRLFVDYTRCYDHHHWRAAVALAEEIVQRYPTHSRTEKIETDLPLLRENAAAEERREQEHRFRDLLKAGHLREAESVAHAVIDKYPASVAAAELQKLLPRINEMIRQNEHVLTGSAKL